MEKDNEVAGQGNSVNFGARILDPRLGRWLSLDPLMAKYPNLTPYNFCANSPILFLDYNGEDLIVGGTPEERAKGIEDLRSLLSDENKSRLKVADDGTVTIDLTVESGRAIGMREGGHYEDAGLELLVNLTTASEKYMYQAAFGEYTEEVIYNEYTGASSTRTKDIRKDANGVANISTTKRTPDGPGEEGALANKSPVVPGGGFDGKVIVDGNKVFTEDGQTKPRASVVFHELWENWERTTNKLPYDFPVYKNGKPIYKQGLKIVYDENRDGAHDKAVEAEEHLPDKSKYPGQTDQ